MHCEKWGKQKQYEAEPLMNFLESVAFLPPRPLDRDAASAQKYYSRHFPPGIRSPATMTMQHGRCARTKHHYFHYSFTSGGYFFSFYFLFLLFLAVCGKKSKPYVTNRKYFGARAQAAAAGEIRREAAARAHILVIILRNGSVGCSAPLPVPPVAQSRRTFFS